MSGSNAGMTSNPWPSSDWVAFVSERGLAAAALLALAFMAMATRGLQCLLNARDSDDALRATALLATLLAVAVAGLFDAVLMLGLPALLVWAALGALDVTDATRMKLLPASFARFALAGVVLFAAVGTVRSASQLAGMWIHAARSDVRWLAAGARIDPGNYDLRVRLARSGSGLGRNARCRHARAAHALYPSAREAARLSRSCE
jgi:hypothetical protein